MRFSASIFATLFLTAAPAFADMQAQVLAPWDGKKVPAGQQCKLHGGNGATPPFQVTGMPTDTVLVLVEYNDRSYSPLSKNGGHGTIGYSVTGGSAKLPSVPGMTAKMPKGVRVYARARSSGDYASPGYLPPCSGGRGNKYEATVKAVNAAGKVTDQTKMALGRY